MNPSLPLPLSSSFPRALSRGLAALLALGLAGGALALVVGSETPRGAVFGQVTDGTGTLKLGLARIVLSPANDREASRAELDDSPQQTRRITADKTGAFQLLGVPAGDYYLSATTKAHQSTGDRLLVSISEGETSQVALHLSRSQPSLALAQNQKTFVPGEKVVLPVRGYVSGEDGKDLKSLVVKSAAANGASVNTPPTKVDPNKIGQAFSGSVVSRTSPTNGLRLRVWRSHLSDIMLSSSGPQDLRTVGDRWGDPHPIPTTLLRPKDMAAPQLVSDTRLPIRSADTEGFFHEKLALPSQPGLYLAQVDHAGISACAWVQVGATALVTKKAGDTLLAFAADVRSGAPRGGFVVRALREGKQVARGVTDAQGLARLNIAGKKPAPDEESRTEGEEGDSEGESSSLLVVATKSGAQGQDDESAIQSNSYDYEERGDYSVATLTDRPIYRPGQRIFYKGIARKILEKGVRYSVPTNQGVEVELRDPDGNPVLREARTANDYGAFWGRAELSPEAPSGTYTLVTMVAGEKHTEDVTVASYRKPEFSVTVKPAQKRYTRGETVEATVSAQYFFGAPVAGGKVHYTVLREADWAAEYAEGDYDDLDEESAEDGGAYGEVETSGDLVLDDQGRATLRLPSITPDKKKDDTDADENGYTDGAYEYEPQADKWTISTYVTDAAGREQSGDGVARITQGDYRVFVEPQGWLAQPGQPLPVTLRALDYEGKPVVGAKLQLQAALYQEPQLNKDGKVEGDGYETTFATQSVTTDASGAAQAQVTPPKAGQARLTVAGADQNGHDLSAQGYVYVVGADEDADAWDWGGRNSLTLVADKRHYQAGQTARVMLGAAQPGQVALLTIEGNGLYKAWTVPLKGHATLVQVPVTDAYGPNVYLAACTLHDKQLAKAQIPLRVDNSAHDIQVKVTPDNAQAGPGEQAGFSVQTTDAGGKPLACDVALGVVDEGIYAMKEDDPKLLRDTFYPRRENNVTTGFSLDVEYLGEGDKADPVIQARRKFEDTAFWLPSLQTDATGKAHVNFKLPDNLTTWRATAWAQSKGSAFGRSTGTMLETKPFFVRLETPRFWVDGDNSRVLATVHNTTTQEQNATVKLEADGLQVDGDSQSVSIPAGGSQTVTWPVTPQMTGVTAEGDARLKLSAWTGDRALTDAVEQLVPIQAHGRAAIESGSGQVTASSPASLTVNLPSNSVPQAARLTVRLAPTLAGSLVGALDYLTGFPYGCTEQTLSRFVPDLALESLLRQQHPTTTAVLETSAGLRPLDDGNAQRRALLTRMVNNGVMRLSRFQHSSGGWGWWENDTDDAWMTAYALYGLTSARDQGYTVRPDMIENGVAGGSKLVTQIRANAKAWQSDREALPFLLWSLSNASNQGRAFAAKIRPSLRISDKTTNEELAYLVMLDQKLGALPIAGKMAAPPEAIKAAFFKGMVTGDDGRPFWKGADKYEGDRMATALGLRALLALDPNDARAQSVLLWLLAHRTGDYWESTRDTSLVLLAMTDYLRLHPELTDSSGTLKVRLNGRDLQTLTLGSNLLREAEIAVPVPWQELQKGANTLQITREGGKSPAFYTYQMRTVGEAQELPPVASGQMNVKREYLKVLPLKNGQNSWSLQTQPSDGNFAQGDQVKVRLTIWNPRPLEHVLVEDHFPSNLEVTERGEANEDTSYEWDSWWSNTDVRDDRIAFFARRMSPGKHIIEYNLRAQTPGGGNALPTLVQEMYAPSVRAETGDRKITVSG